ncbi:WD40 repeat-like protein [Rhodotorula kratochvilovae]
MASKGSLVQTSIVVPAPTTVRGHSTKLYTTPDGRSIVYGAGRAAVLRPLESSAGAGEARLFAHVQNITIVWDPTGKYLLKLEVKLLTKINDVAAEGEGKRLVVGGEGSSGWGASFSLDTGSSYGKISGHIKAVNVGVMRPGWPFRAVTGSDEFSVCGLNGVAFKYALTSWCHTHFVHSVAYTPSGAVLLYDGTSGKDKGALVDEGAESAHAKTVFAASFAQDGRMLMTSVADATVKLWDVESGKVVQRWGFDEGNEVASQQVVLDLPSETPVHTLLGHQNPVMALTVVGPNYDTFLRSESVGRVLIIGAESGEVSALKGVGHKGLVLDAVQSQEGGRFVSAEYDDAVNALHRGGINMVAWAGEDKLVSTGADGAIRVLEVKSA